MEPVVDLDDNQSLYPERPEKDPKSPQVQQEPADENDHSFAIVPLNDADFQATSTPLDNRPRLDLSRSSLNDSPLSDSSSSEFHGFSSISNWSVIDPTISPQPTIYYSSSDDENEDDVRDKDEHESFNLNRVRRQLSYPCEDQPED